MIPLLVLSVLSVALIIERCWFWLSTCGKISLRRLESLNKSFMVGDTESVRKMVTRDTSLFGVIATKLVEDGPSDAVAMGAVEMQRPRIDRNMVALSTIITAAPLLGILGTVIGIIEMITVFVALLIVGFLVWRMIAHPIHSAQVLGTVVGLLLLGTMAVGLFLMGLVWLLE